jgi:hypothetical protein
MGAQVNEPILTVTFDKAALKAEAEQLLRGSPLWAQIQGGLVLDIRHPEQAFGVLGDLVKNVCASVEVVKQNFVAEHDPDGILGLKFDGKLAFELALEILDEAIKFGGVFGPAIEWADRPLLKFFIEIGIAAWRGKDWLATAKVLLALV